MTDPVYRELPPDHDAPIVQAVAMKGFTKSYLSKVLPESRLRQDEGDVKYASLLLEDTRKPTKKYDLRHRKRKTLTVAEKQRLKLYDLAPNEIKYALYVPLHQLWMDYIRDLLNIPKLTARNLKDAEIRLMKADLHGSLLTVARSTCPSLVGQSGILLQETKHTFKIVTEDDSLKTIPKKNAIFCICVDSYNFRIYGNNFLFRASDRVTRSFKHKPFIDL